MPTVALVERMHAIHVIVMTMSRLTLSNNPLPAFRLNRNGLTLADFGCVAFDSVNSLSADD